jgi:hypothetical protein
VEEGRRGEFDVEGLTGGNGSRGSSGVRAGRGSGGLLLVREGGEEGLDAAKPRDVRSGQGCGKGSARARHRTCPAAWRVRAGQGRHTGCGKSPVLGPVGG